MTIEAVVFDLYGTLVYMGNDTKPYIRLFREIGFNDTEEIRQICFTEDFTDLSKLANRFKFNNHDKIKQYEDKISEELKTAALYPDTVNVLKKLRRDGYKIGVISNLASPYKKPFFDLGLTDLVDCYVFSCEYGRKKPDKEIYLHIINELGAKPEQTLMIGNDLVNDFKEPRLVGINTILLDRKNRFDLQERICCLDEVFQFITRTT